MPLPDVKIIISGIDKFSSTIGKSMKGLDRIGRKTAQVGKSFTRNVTLPIVGVASAATISSIRINEAMANVGTLIPGNIKRLEEMKTSVQSLALETGKAQTDIAEGLFQTISAFGDQENSMDKLRIAARAGVAGRSETIDSLNLLSSVTKAYDDITTTTTQKVADLAFKTNELGQTTFPEMAENMGKIAPLASTLDITMEELFGTLAAATGVTGDTARVSTQLAGVMGALLKPTKDMEVAFKKLGVRTGKELIQQHGLQGSLKLLQDLTEKYNIPLGKLLGRKEALSLTFALNNQLADAFTEKLAKMENVSGSTEKAFKEQSEGINKLGFQWNQLKVRTGIVLAQFGDKLSPTLTKLIDNQIVPLLDKITNLSDEQVEWIFKIGGVVAAIGPLLVVIGTLISAIAKIGMALKIAFVGIKGLIAGLTVANPLVLLIAAAILIWAHNIMEIYKNWDDLVFLFKFWWKKLVVGFQGMVQSIVKAFAPLMDLFHEIINTIVDIGKAIGRFILPKGLEHKFGLTPEESMAGRAGGAGEALRSVVDVSGKSEFAGKLVIEGAPPRSKVEVEKSGGMEIEMDSGLLLAGVGR